LSNTKYRIHDDNSNHNQRAFFVSHQERYCSRYGKNQHHDVFLLINDAVKQTDFLFTLDRIWT
jgi:hypothetical protein